MSTRRIYTHYLNATKGWPAPYALDKEAPVADDTVTIFKGMVMCLNADGEFKAGLDCGAMPVISHRNADEGDVRQEFNNMMGGKIGGLVCSGPFEVETTEYDDSVAYPPNTPLTAVNLGATRGQITTGQFYLDTICGVVSDGLVTPTNYGSLLRFWTYFLPPLECQPSSAA